MLRQFIAQDIVSFVAAGQVSVPARMQVSELIAVGVVMTHYAA